MSHSKITSIRVDSGSRAIGGARGAYAEKVKAPERGIVDVKPKAYSYVRFSTPEQAKGDSLRRQMDRARAWATSQGLEMDEALTFHDKGMSARWGKNAADGALAAFLVAAKDGLVPEGSYLIVESLDRISRQTVRKAVRTLELIVEAGVNLVDLEDAGRVYNVETLDNDSMAFLIMAIRFMRANQESVLKGDRVRRAYDNKRRVATTRQATDKPFTRMLPAWLYWDENAREIRAHADRAEIVRTIFEKTVDGWGQHKIAHWLNQEGTPTWGGADYWHRSYVKKVLSNPAVIGTFTPHHRLRDEKHGQTEAKAP